MTETHGFSSCFSYPCPFFGQSHSGFRQAACCADCPLLMTGIVGLSQIWQMTIQTCWIVGTGKYHEDLITYQMPASKQLYTHTYIYICVCVYTDVKSYHIMLYIYIHIYIYATPPLLYLPLAFVDNVDSTRWVHCFGNWYWKWICHWW